MDTKVNTSVKHLNSCFLKPARFIRNGAGFLVASPRIRPPNPAGRFFPIEGGFARMKPNPMVPKEPTPGLPFCGGVS